VAVIDIGKPGKNLGWAITGPKVSKDGTCLDQCVELLAEALRAGPLALGFEAPMFVPARQDPCVLLSARRGECENGVSRPFSAAPGATVLVVGLVVVPYVLARLRDKVREATATLDWRSRPFGLLLFEAFVTNQKKKTDTRHVEDARLAVAEFERGMHNPATFRSSVVEPRCLNLLGAILLRTGWTTDLKILCQPCLVVRA
jgi:hypothetical protein